MYLQIMDSLISNEQAETFAYNIYRDISEYIKANFDDFFVWNLETNSEKIVLAIGCIVFIKNSYCYDACKY